VIVQDEKIAYANESAAAPLGYSPAEIIGRSYLDFIRPDLVGYVRDLHRKRVMGRPVPDEYETFMVSKQGEARCYQVRVQTTRYRGKKAFALGLTPLDAWREKERISCQNEKREALGRMAAGVGREVACWAGLLEEGATALRDLDLNAQPGLATAWEKVVGARESLLSLGKAMAELSSHPCNRSHLTRFDLRKVVQDVVTMIRPRLIEEKGTGEPAVRIKTYLRSLSPVEGRPEEIRDALSEMILNSVESLPEGGDIYVTTEEDSGYANVYIQDNGKGVPACIREKIFDPFFSTKEERAGLGLSLAQAAICRHGGEMDFISREGEGTTVLIRLPLPRKPEPPAKRRFRRQVKNSHVIILSPEHMVGALLAGLFTGKGGRVTVVSTAADCMRALKKPKVDVLIVDSEIREEGFSLFVDRYRGENRDVRVAVISAQEPDAANLASPFRGADLIIGRPLDLDLILRQVIEAMNAEGRNPQ
jgi:PAS domain S-box-containing protein